MASHVSYELRPEDLEVAAELDRLRAELERLGQEMDGLRDRRRLIEVHRERARLALALSGIVFELSRERQAVEPPARFPRATVPPRRF
jgi:hypothetical protein